jgi:Flp pilus assembly CpaE family ATPase
MHHGVLIVSANEDIAVPLWHAFERAGVRAEIVPAGEPALQFVGGRLSAARDTAWGVVVEAAGRGQGTDLIRRVRQSFPQVVILAALAAPNLATTQAATQAGAWDYLIHPFGEDQIAACLPLWGQTPALSSPGRMVCFLPASAGDGASTVALHVAEAAVHERRARGFSGRVLLVDLDFQAGDVAFRLQLEPPRTIADALQAADFAAPRWRDWVCPYGQVDVLASPPAAAGTAKDRPCEGGTGESGAGEYDAGEYGAGEHGTDKSGGRTDQASRMAALMSSAKACYPFVVCDMPPAMYSSSPAVLHLADEVCVVCTPEITSLHFARRRIDELQQAGVAANRIILVLNREGSHPWVGAEEANRAAGMPVSVRLPNDYKGLQAAIVQGDVVAHRSLLGRQIRELTRHTLGVRARVAAA